MKTYKRAVAMFAVLLGGVITLIALATPGNAAPYTPSISINTPLCAPGPITGSGFAPNESVTVTLSPGGQVVATTTTTSTGTFSTTATFPSSVKGSRLLTATGSSGDKASKRVSINTNCGVGGVSSSRANSSTSHGTGSLSSTGVAVWTIAGLGVLLLAAGALFTFGGRRGRRA